MDHLVSPHHDLDHVFASWTPNHDTPANSKIPQLLPIESEVIDAVRQSNSAILLVAVSGYIWSSFGEEERGKAIITELD